MRSQTVERIDSYSYDCEAVLVPGEGGIGSIFHYIKGRFEAHQRVYVVRNFSHAVEPKFVYYAMASLFPRQAARHSVKAAVDSLRLPTFKSFVFPCPADRAVQRRIALLFSACDHAIQAAEDLITAKLEFKRGLMQELLTGKRRFPGFSGEWRDQRLGDVARIGTGSRDNQDKVAGGEYPFFVRSQHVERIDSYSYDCDAVLVPGEGGVGSIFHYVQGKFEAHQRVYVIREFADSVCPKFIYYAITNGFGRQAKRHSVKAAVDSLRLPTFQSFSFPCPTECDEQRRVSRFFSLLDTEISHLQALAENLRDQKRGLMQRVFSGEIDLPELAGNAGAETEVPA